ncbi:FecCD family ABC transporter permease [Oharaeibacter diazotrophicus]|uniref:Iron complex transport system permease protein n=1 Tax=Oharaeibacter diazotrophicus TaxID=1920512 RepID=A0A4R6RBS3_9HYPH|nr:iron ABC transporter permease [Oharaeibacter diazotrophicus]TDP83519.1 iron complex transport system permease protein [Oharaeibacter diazotrophicus]BBE72352.1 hemin transport system permease protein HmuU [Pleomorphomonas sp. SM30]GLS79122.1 heme ABC transporter permease [Oharaeibacter diazotrophicus]
MTAVAGRFLAAAPPGDRGRRGLVVVLLAAVLALAAALVSLAAGPTGVGLSDLFAWLAGDAVSERDRLILEAVRLPRAALGAMVGAGLAVSGAMMQGLFRNPLADPGLVGVSSGAATAAVAVIVLGGALPAALPAFFGPYLLPTAAFAGGLANTALLYALATRGGRTDTATLILAGIAVASVAGAVTGLMLFIADDAALRDVAFWSLGSLGGATATKVAAVAPFVIGALAATPFAARGLDALLLGEAEAVHLGVPVERLKRVVIVAVAAASGATVAVTGAIGFVGIVVPHLVRLAIGPGHRMLLPASAFGGAALMLAADALCRVVAAPAELPIGIVTAAIGAPVFLAILLGRSGADIRGE